MCRVSPKSSEVFGLKDPLELRRCLVLEFLSSVAHQEVDRPSPRAVQPADRLDLGQDHLCSTSLSVPNWRTTLAPARENSPDRGVIEVNQKAVAGRKLDPLARYVHGILGRGGTQPVAARSVPDWCRSGGRRLAAIDSRASTVRLVSE